MSMIQEQTWMTSREVADYIRVSYVTLRTWRHEGKGPPYVKFADVTSGPVRYRKQDVDDWMASKQQSVTAE